MSGPSRPVVDEWARTLGDGWRVPDDPPDPDHRTDLPIAAMRQALVISDPVAARSPRA